MPKDNTPIINRPNIPEYFRNKDFQEILVTAFKKEISKEILENGAMSEEEFFNLVENKDA